MAIATKRHVPRAVAGALAAAGAALAVAAPARAADPILPLGEVRPGMVGTAYTVVSGTRIETFPVTVLDVTRAGDGPGSSLIIIRAEGPLMERTGGIAQGMSGSPVYVTGADGVPRVIGAIAYGQGDEDNVIGGVTPIEQMIANASGARAMERVPAEGPQRPVLIARTGDQARRLRAAHPDARVMRPLMRWTASGVHPRLAMGLRRALGDGVQVDMTGPATPRPRVTLQPGASVAAQVMTGPVALGAIGTVTYVDGDTVLAFGHPFLDAGPERLLMSDAHITTVVSAPIKGESYKLGEAGNVQGMITGDRRDGVVGRLGRPDAVSIVADARDVARGTTQHMEGVVAPQPELLPLSADLMMLEPLMRVRDGSGRGTVTARYTVETPGLPTIRYRNVYAAQGDVVALSGGRLGSIISTLTDNPVRVMVPSRIAIDVAIAPEVRAGTIVSARTATRFVRPGRRAHLVLNVRMWRGPVRRVVVPFRVPRDLDRGTTRLRVVANDSTSADLVSALQGDGAAVRGVVRRPLVEESPKGTAARRVMRLVNLGMNDRHDAVRLLTPGQDAEAGDGLTLGTKGLVIAGGSASFPARIR